jgi:hypothetical protein
MELILWKLSSIQMSILNNIICNLNLNWIKIQFDWILVLIKLDSNLIQIPNLNSNTFNGIWIQFQFN